jgi:transposase-like protein
VEEMGYTSAKRALQLGNERKMQDLHRAHNIERDALKNFLQKAEKASAEQGRISDALRAKVKSLQVELQKARAESKSLQVELQKARAEVKSSQVESQKANDENQLILDKIVKINKRFSPSAEGSKNTSAR